MDRQKLLNALQGTPWAIDIGWGLTTYLNFLNEVELIAAGVPAKDVLSRYKSDVAYPRRLDTQGRTADNGEIMTVYMSGLMTEDGGACSRGIRDLVNDLESANQNSDIKGVLLEINSGGGYATAGHMLQSALADMNKPVVTFGHFVGSAAYMAASATSEIVASNTGASFGSIGTLVQFSNEALTELRENYTTLYSRLSTRKNHEVRSLLAGDTGPIIDQLDALSNDFISKVKKHRNITDKDVFSGGMYDAKTAKSNGLIDNIGPKSKALRILNRHIKISQ